MQGAVKREAALWTLPSVFMYLRSLCLTATDIHQVQQRYTASVLLGCRGGLLLGCQGGLLQLHRVSEELAVVVLATLIGCVCRCTCDTTMLQMYMTTNVPLESAVWSKTIMCMAKGHIAPMLNKLLEQKMMLKRLQVLKEPIKSSHLRMRHKSEPGRHLHVQPRTIYIS